MTKATNFSEVEKTLGYEFKNKTLLEQAFTRRSYTAENGGENNEVLEFIGDSALGMIIVKHISGYYKRKEISPEIIEAYLKVADQNCQKYVERNQFRSELDESELSELKIALVQRSSLAAATEKCGFHNYLIMGKSDIEGGVQNEASVKEDLFEAIIGAVAIDSNWNMNILEEIILRLLDVDRVLEEGLPSEPDYEKELKQWFDSHGKIMQVESMPTDFDKLDYGVCIDLGYEMLSYLAYGYGKTLPGARRMAAKRAMAFIGKTNNMAEKIKNAIGNIDHERAINQLQELWQKGIIPKPEYRFSEGKKSQSGNPQWVCSCTIDRIYETSGEYVCESKTEAKKWAAYEAIFYLMGKDIARIFVDYGKVIKEDN